MPGVLRKGHEVPVEVRIYCTVTHGEYCTEMLHSPYTSPLLPGTKQCQVDPGSGLGICRSRPENAISATRPPEYKSFTSDTQFVNKPVYKNIRCSAFDFLSEKRPCPTRDGDIADMAKS
jgi:hypothetical protein